MTRSAQHFKLVSSALCALAVTPTLTLAEPNDVRRSGPHAENTLYAEHRVGWRPWFVGDLILAEAAVEMRTNNVEPQVPAFDMASLPDPLPAMNRVEPVDAQRAAILAGVVPVSVAATVAEAFADGGDLPGIEVVFDPDAAPADLPADRMEQIAGGLDTMDVRVDEAGEVIAMSMASGLLFEFGRAGLADESVSTLAALAEQMSTSTQIEVVGHTDAIGAEDSNLQLAQQRAERVREWLIDNGGIDADIIIASSRGEQDPIAPNTLSNGNDNPEGRALNRRVEFVLQ